METKPCALCHQPDPDTSMKYTYEVKRVIPHVLPTGQTTGKEWTEQTQKFDMQLPVHAKCKGNGPLGKALFIALIVEILLLLGFCVLGTFVQPLAERIPFFPIPIVMVLLLITGLVVFWILPRREKGRISLWLSRHEPELWAEINRNPLAGN